MSLEEQLDKYFEACENAAWNKVKEKMIPEGNKFIKSIEGLIKDAFLVGYNHGRVDEEIFLKELSSVDPVGFYDWLKQK